MSNFRPYSDVLVREVPDSFDKAIGAEGKDLDVELARKQHEAYVNALKKAGARVHYLPRNNHQPDSVFVEDIAIIIGDRVLLTKPKVESRRYEVSEDLANLFEGKYGLRVSEVTDDAATLDGGDVIFTGKEILAGISDRTNARGIQELRETFPSYEVVEVDVRGPLHLTTMMGLFGEDTLCISSESRHGRTMLDQINKRSKTRYRQVEVAEDVAANCIAINGTLLCKGKKENSRSYGIVKGAAGGREVIGLELSEIEKAIGSLTCMSLRFSLAKMGCSIL